MQSYRLRSNNLETPAALLAHNDKPLMTILDAKSHCNCCMNIHLRSILGRQEVVNLIICELFLMNNTIFF